MSKELDLIQRQQIETIDGCPTGNVYIGLTFDELAELETELKVLDIFKKYFDFKILDDGRNYFLEVGYLWRDKWSFVARRISNRKELSICKKALGIKRTHRHKYSKGNGVYYECSPIFNEYKKQEKILRIIKEKKVDIWYLSQVDSVETYNNNRNSNYWLTQSEFVILKEVLGNETF